MDGTEPQDGGAGPVDDSAGAVDGGAGPQTDVTEEPRDDIDAPRDDVTEPREAVDERRDGAGGSVDGPARGDGPRPEGGAGPGALTAQHRAVLALERRGWPGPGAKERAIRERLGLAPVRYYQLLNALLDDPRALAHDPVTVNRLRRIREARRAAR